METDYGMPDLAWEREMEKRGREQRRLEAQRRRLPEQAQRLAYKTKPQAQAPRGPRGGNR